MPCVVPIFSRQRRTSVSDQRFACHKRPSAGLATCSGDSKLSSHAVASEGTVCRMVIRSRRNQATTSSSHAGPIGESGRQSVAPVLKG